jgi:predicted aspartyl protease
MGLVVTTMAQQGYRFVNNLLDMPILRPVVSLALANKGGWRVVEATLDYGADITMIPNKLADELIQYPPFTVEDIIEPSGNSVVGRGMVVLAQVEGKTFYLPVLAVEKVPTILLGRLGFMDNFAVTFHPKYFEVIPL